jgi:hypothetical protein
MKNRGWGKHIGTGWTRVLAVVLLSSCGGGGDGPGSGRPPAQNPFADYVPDPQTYTQAPDPARTLTVTGPGGETKFPYDQMLVQVTAGTTRETVSTLAASLGGTIVGQIPAIDLYQIRLDTASSQNDLDAAIAQAQANPAVVDAVYNLLTYGLAKCPPITDLEGMALNDRCPFSDIGYYTAMTIFEAVRPSLTLSTVRVAVIDTGIAAGNGEFDNVKILNLDHPGAPIAIPDFHGTAVAGIIAADDDEGVNGIASAFLKDKLQLLWGGGDDDSTIGVMAAVKRAADAKAAVVNMSFGYGDLSAAVHPCNQIWRALMTHYPDVLFVTAAPNSPVQVTSTNAAPAGIPLNNVITVGGTALCQPLQRWTSSGYGPGVDMGAPAQNIPHVAQIVGHNYLNVDSGNSFAAPMVTSLAAILRSLNPYLAASLVKNDYIVKYTYPTSAQLQGRLLSLPLAIEQFLLDLVPGVPPSVRTLLDQDNDGTWDEPGMVVNRICGGLNYQVNGYGSYSYSSGNDKTWLWGVINPTGFVLSTPADITSSDALLTLNCVTCSFQVGATFPITDSGTGNPGTAEMSFTQNQSAIGFSPFGYSLSGNWDLDSCRIVERDPLFKDPLWVQVRGDFTATLRMMDPPSPNLHDEAVNGYFNLLFATLPLIGSGSPTIDYLENHCEGGIP